MQIMSVGFHYSIIFQNEFVLPNRGANLPPSVARGLGAPATSGQVQRLVSGYFSVITSGTAIHSSNEV